MCGDVGLSLARRRCWRIVGLLLGLMCELLGGLGALVEGGECRAGVVCLVVWLALVVWRFCLLGRVRSGLVWGGGCMSVFRCFGGV